MPLTLLLPLVVLGIAGIGVLLHLSGQSRPFVIPDAETARREWLRHWPGDTVRAVHLSGGAALIETAQGEAGQGLGLVRPFGADTVAHRLTGMTERGAALRLSFGDIAAPAVTLTLPPATRAAWLSLWRGRDA